MTLFPWIANRFKTGVPFKVGGKVRHPSWGRSLFMLTLIGFAVTRYGILVGFEPMYSDIGHFFQFGVRASQGNAPYRDFEFEYPPLAWTIVAVAKGQSEGDEILQSQASLNIFYKKFSFRFRLQMFVLDVFSFVLFILISKRFRARFSSFPAIAYLAATTPLAHLLYDRLDIGLLFFILLWLYAWLRSDGSFSRFWCGVSYVALGLGISFKLIPLLVVPFVLLTDRGHFAHLSSAIWRVVLLLLSCLAPFLYYYQTAGIGVFSFLTYHGSRGLQVESTLATLLLLLRPFGYSVEARHGFGGWNLESALSGSLETLAGILLPLCVAVIFLWGVKHRAHLSKRNSSLLGVLVIVGSVCLSKVFSPQYLLWALPLAALLAPCGLTLRGKLLYLTAIVVIAGLSTWVFPYNYFSENVFPMGEPISNPKGLIPGFSSTAIGVLAARNFIYFLVVIYLARSIFVRVGSSREKIR